MARRILILVVLVLSILLVLFSSAALSAAREGLTLWATMVLPALFPFFVCATLLQKSGVLECATKNSRLLKKLGIPAYALPMMGLSAISGAPTGARLSAFLEEEGAFSPALGIRYAAIFNLASPMFLFGSLGAGMLNDPRAALPIALGQYGSSLLLLIGSSLLFPRPAGKECLPKPAPNNTDRPVHAIVTALSEGVNGMLKIGASIVFFMVLIRMLEEVGFLPLIVRMGAPLLEPLNIQEATLKAAITGMLEMTSGCATAAALAVPIRLKVALCAGIVTFGGFCMLLQSLSFYELKPLRYLLWKLPQAALAFLITYVTAPWFLQGATETFAPVSFETVQYNLFSGGMVLASSLLGLSLAWLFAAVCKKRMRKQSHIR